MQGKFIYTQKDRARTVRSMLRKYEANKRQVDAFDQGAEEFGCREPSAVRSTKVSDPTARIACKRADVPSGIQYRREWVAAINDARAECKVVDEHEDFGYNLEFVLVSAYSLDGQPAMTRQEIMKRCNFSTVTYYNRMSMITEIVMHHATKHGLL